jgi:hypothetical protein
MMLRNDSIAIMTKGRTTYKAMPGLTLNNVRKVTNNGCK